MELVYVTRAIKRYWWITALGALLGLLGGFFLGAGGEATYSSQALVLIAPPGEGLGSTSTDRYLQNQLLVFGSGALADQVASTAGAEGTPVNQWTSFEQVPGSDMVRITVAAPTAELSQTVANAYVESYLDAVRGQLDDAQAPDVDAINVALEEVDAAIDGVDQQIEAALAPFLQSGVPEAALPTIEQVSPTLATQRQVLLDQYIELLRDRNELELGAQTRASSQVIQRASLPTEPDPRGRNLILFAAPLAGVMFGALLSVAVARASSRVLDLDEVEEVLDVAVAGRLPRDRDLARAGIDLTRPLPETFESVVHELCVRAEASELAGRSLVVAVAGADESAGTTTTALAMAVRFAEAGSDVLLVDMDQRSPDLTEAVGEALSGVRYLASPEPDADGRRPSRSRPPLIGSVLPGVRFAGQGDAGSRRPLRRDEVGRLLDHSAEYAAVTVIDAGVLMDAASSVQLAQTADALVLTVPLSRQRRSALRVCARQLRTARGTILPVITSATGRHRDVEAPPSGVPASEEASVASPESAPTP